MEDACNDNVADVVRFLYDEGLEPTPIVNAVVEKEMNGSEAKSWLKLKEFRKFTDDHIMYGALSEMNFPPGTFVAPSFVSEKLKDIERAREDAGRMQDVDWKELKKERVRKMVQSIGPTLAGHAEVQYCVPVCTDDHWGLCIANYSSGKGYVRWGDSLGKKDYFIETARALASVMDNIYSVNDSLVVRSNYMFDVMRFAPQKDQYSCGFYVIATIGSLATNLGCLEGYGFSEKCCPVVGETLRGQALKSYFARVIEAFDIFKSENEGLSSTVLSTRFTEFHVYRHINSNRLRHVFQQKMLEPLATTPSTCDGVQVGNPLAYITELNIGGACFRMDNKEVQAGTRNSNFVVKVTSYSCHRDDGACPAKISFNFMKDGRIFALRSALHSHAP